MALRSVNRSAVTCIVGTPCFSLKMINYSEVFLKLLKCAVLSFELYRSYIIVRSIIFFWIFFIITDLVSFLIGNS